MRRQHVHVHVRMPRLQPQPHSRPHFTGRSDPATAARTNLKAVPAGLRYASNCKLTDPLAWVPDVIGCETHMQPGDVLFFREDGKC